MLGYVLSLQPMKKYAIVAALFTLLLSACSTDFDIAADYEETLVVYGLLDASQDTQYIRISRGFISADRSALEVALEPDSIYYLADQLAVTIERESDGAVFTFTEDRSIAKDTGVFGVAPHLVYALPQKLEANDAFRLRIENTVTGKIVTSYTSMVDSFRLTQPSDIQAFEFTTSLVSKFPNGLPQNIEVTFTAPVDGKVYDVAVRFYYRQWEGAVVGPGDTMFVEYLFEKGLVSASLAGANPNPGGQPVVARYFGQDLLSYIASELSANPNITREPLQLPLEYVYYAGGQDLYDMIRTSQGGTGITALEAKPIYSNIEGGYGVFSSRFSKTRPNVGINTPSKDSLACGQLTRALNFNVDVPTSCN